MRIILSLYIILGLLSSTFAQSRHVEVIKFSQFQSFLDKQNDTLYVMNFWATWCKPCVEELPYFDDIDQNFKDSKVKVILVSLDFSDELETRLIPFIRNKEITSKVILLDESNPNTFIDKVSPEWSGAIPATFMFKGKESAFYERSFTYPELESIINQKLSK
jgi:thiol-disulfide isomerase/thioredoxin